MEVLLVLFIESSFLLELKACYKNQFLSVVRDEFYIRGFI